MPLDVLFSGGNILALAGWLVLAASPLLPDQLLVIPRIVIPGLIGIAYISLILSGWSDAHGGFSSLDEIALLFQSRPVLLAGWLHYLAFDLFVGSWEVEAGRRAGVPFWLVLPCLAATFLFGPAGLVLFLALRAVSSRPAPPSTAQRRAS